MSEVAYALILSGAIPGNQLSEPPILLQPLLPLVEQNYYLPRYRFTEVSLHSEIVTQLVIAAATYYYAVNGDTLAYLTSAP